MYENSQDPVHVVFLHTRITGAQFDPCRGAMQEIDFRRDAARHDERADAPLGRRWLWTRTVECILPNINQTGAIWEDADARRSCSSASA